jgi:hypothetical protein
MNKDYFNIGVRPKHSYVAQGGIRGLGAKNMSVDANKEYIKSKNPNVEIYAERWDQGLDIWTGEPLEGDGLADWQNQRKKRNQLE